MPALTAADIGRGTPPGLRAGDTLLAVCLCAAWCRTCDGFRADFDALADRHPQAVFVWLDVEDDWALVDGIEVETFPTIVLQRGADVVFAGPVPPQAATVERLCADAATSGARVDDPAFDFRGRLGAAGW